MPLHVSSSMCSSSGGQKLYYTASGIITPIGGRPVHKICFTIGLFHACTCFEHHVLIVRRSKIVLYSLWYRHTFRCVSLAVARRTLRGVRFTQYDMLPQH